MLCRQEPAAKSLRGVVNTMAPCELAQTVHLCLNKLENTAMNLFVLLKCLLEMVEGNANRCTGQLHTAVCRHISWTNKVQAPDEALATHGGNLGG